MAHLTVSVEYAVHSLLWMIGAGDRPASCRDLAELQGISHSFLAKIFPKLERAGIVRATEGVSGGYVLARPAAEISVLQVVDAIEGRKPLFDCQDIRERCALFGASPPAWATRGVCSIHKVMLQAEKAMRDALAAHSLADIGQAVGDKAPSDFPVMVDAWFGGRTRGRAGKPRKGAAQSQPKREVS